MDLWAHNGEYALNLCESGLECAVSNPWAQCWGRAFADPWAMMVAYSWKNGYKIGEQKYHASEGEERRKCSKVQTWDPCGETKM